MKKLIPVFSAIIMLTVSCGRSRDEFVVSRDRLSSEYRSRIDTLKKNRSSFFEDNRYVVSRTCYGEWGGIIIFKNKASGIEYVCGGTCPIAVNKLNGKYFITNTLNQMNGSSEVLEIDHPDSLNVFYGGQEKNISAYVADSGSRKGTLQLLDTTGVLTIGSFPYNNELYHVVADNKRTYLAKIQNRKLVPVKELTDKNLWTGNMDVVKVDGNHYVMSIQQGYLDIFNNVITIMTNNP